MRAHLLYLLLDGFDPDTDLIRNSYGMLEFAGNKPALEQDWDRYLAARAEDDNCT